jgi:hypothetical protein
MKWNHILINILTNLPKWSIQPTLSYVGYLGQPKGFLSYLTSVPKGYLGANLRTF